MQQLIGWFGSPVDQPLQQLIEKSRPAWQRWLLGIGRRFIGLPYAVTLTIWLTVAPLVAARYHLVSPVGILIGPPVILLTACALLFGFLLLLTGFCPPLASVFALFTHWSLAGCQWLVN